jgi:hypothetical protein
MELQRLLSVHSSPHLSLTHGFGLTMPLSGLRPTKKTHTGTAQVQKVHNDPSVPTYLIHRLVTIGIPDTTTI